jgi:hypothetical protein
MQLRKYTVCFQNYHFSHFSYIFKESETLKNTPSNHLFNFRLSVKKGNTAECLSLHIIKTTNRFTEKCVNIICACSHVNCLHKKFKLLVRALIPF